MRRKRKMTAAVVAGALMASILLTGTLAWRSISQTVRNEIVRSVNPGGRLHDDFNGSNKDIYVENFMSVNEGGQPIFARIKLYEYMELGMGAGEADNPDRAAASLMAGAVIDDEKTWTVHVPKEGDPYHCTGTSGEGKSFHDYWKWDLGGETVFMPTFNKNKDSLSADVNGTWEGLAPGNDQHFDDYTVYHAGDTETDTEYYDADGNVEDEYDGTLGTVPGGSGELNVNYTAKDSVEHTARATQKASVITMQSWVKAGRPMGRYWVWDTDGWAYWAEAIQPGEATGLLLDGITFNDPSVSDSCYYSIYVEAQFATKNDWGTAGEEGEPSTATGFYIDGAPASDALYLLDQAAGNGYSVAVTSGEGKDTLAPGDTLQLNAAVICNSTQVVGQTVTWSVAGQTSGDTGIGEDGLLTVGADEAAATLTVTAAAWTGDSADFSVTVTASPPEGICVQLRKWYNKAHGKCNVREADRGTA